MKSVADARARVRRGGGGAFASLIAPMSPAAFLARHWRRRPLRSRRAAWRSCVGFTMDDFKGGLATFPNVKAQFLSGGRHRETAIEATQAQDLYDAGMSICVAGIESRYPTLAAFAERCRDELRFAGHVLVNAYWSPAGGGFGTHFDEQHVFILQVAGSKRWAISGTAACEAPPSNLVHTPENAAAFRAAHPAVPFEPPDEGSFVEHVLEPGHCLYLPPGTWHRTFAGEFSLALTLTLAYVRFPELLARVVQERMEGLVPWREVLPVGGAPGAGLPRGWREFLEARIREVRELAAALTPETLAEEWLAATLGRPSPGPSGNGRRVGDRDVLVRRERLALLPRDGVVVLLWAGGRCEVPADFEPFCRRLASASRFTPEEARRWTADGEPLDRRDVRGVLRQLAAAGLLGRA